MEELTTIALSAGGGAAGIGFLLRAIALSLPSISAFLKTRAEEKKSAARKDEITAEMVAEFMREMRGRVERAEKANEDCEKRYTDALDLISTLRAEVEELRAAIATGASVPPHIAPGEPAVAAVARLEPVRRANGDGR